VGWAFVLGGLGGNIGASLICLLMSALMDDPVSMFDAELATRGPGAATLALLTAWAGASRGMPIGLMLFGTVRAERLALVLTLVMAGVMSQGGGPSPWAVLIAGGLGWLVGIGKIPPAKGKGKAPPSPKHRFEVIEGGLPEGSPPVRGRGWTGGRSDDGLVH
jgi:hypothetical protein